MSRLKVVLKLDGETVSSLRVEGLKTVPIRQTPRNKWGSPKVIYNTTCEVHNELTPTIPVDTVSWDPDKKVANDLGVRRYCILCWTWIKKTP